METNRQRILSDGAAYNHLFPKATLVDYTVKRGANVEDTVKLIPKVVKLKNWQLKAFVEQELKGLNTFQACEKLWNFVHAHIAYKPDQRNLEQIRTPARSWHDRAMGVDCDCYTTFIASALSLLKIPVVLRITKYKEDRFQHIYPIVPTGKDKYITMDCVVEQFNYEEPYSEKLDTTMDLQILDGIQDSAYSYKGIDADDLLSNNYPFGELGKISLKKVLPKVNLPKINLPKFDQKGKIKETIKQGLHTVNRVNPATLLLRNGILASMKLNVMNVASSLKWTYLPETELNKRGIDKGRWQQLKTVREKLEKIFFGAGGKPENLKEAILTGKGNSAKEVPLSGFYNASYNMGELNEYSPLSTLLGHNIYYSENVQGLEGLGQLGEPVSAAAITAATAAMATIAGLIKSIGSIFPKKEKPSATPAQTSPVTVPNNKQGASPDSGQFSPPAPVNTPGADSGNEQTDTPANPTIQSQGSSDARGSDNSTDEGYTKSEDGSNTSTTTNPNVADPKPANQSSFWENNKKWIKPATWGLGGLTLCYIAYKIMAPKYQKAKTLTGIKTRKQHIQPIALM